MNRYTYQGSDYAEMARGFASQTGAETGRNEIRMPASVARGYTRWAEMPGGISALVSDCVYVNDFILERQPVNGGFYVLQFDLVTDAAGRLFEAPGIPGAAMYFFKPGCGWLLQRKKGMRVRSAKMIITKEWLQQYIPCSAGYTGIFEQHYPNGIFSARLPQRLQALLENITALPNACGPDAVYMQNRLLVMLEIFFQQVHEYFTGMGPAGRLNTHYVARVKHAAGQLAQHVEGTAPSIAGLAAAAAMSSTSFKKYFKLVFGVPVYRYYLELRLAHGRSLLQGGRITVKEVAAKLGYTSVHHFSAAYLKIFGVNPADEKIKI